MWSSGRIYWLDLDDAVSRTRGGGEKELAVEAGVEIQVDRIGLVSVAQMGWIEGQPGRYYLYRGATIIYCLRMQEVPFWLLAHFGISQSSRSAAGIGVVYPSNREESWVGSDAKSLTMITLL